MHPLRGARVPLELDELLDATGSDHDGSSHILARQRLIKERAIPV